MVVSLAARAKMSLSRAQNIFMPANINSIVIIMLYMVSNFRNAFFDTIGQFAKGHSVLIQSEQQIKKAWDSFPIEAGFIAHKVLQFYFSTFPAKLLINTVFLSGCGRHLLTATMYRYQSLRLLGSLSNDDGDGNEDGKKAIGLDWQNNNSARARSFVHFFAVVARLQRGNA